VTSIEENTMLTHPTLDQLKALNLDGMAGAFVELQNHAQAAELSHAEWLALLLDREAANRNTRRFQIRLRSAKLRHSQAVMEIVEDRHGNGSTLITSQLPRDKWHDVIGEPTFADAIMDRIVHNAYRLELDGPSMRKLQAGDASRNSRPAESDQQPAKEAVTK